MAIDLTLKSVPITNREAVPAVLNNPGLGAGGIEKCVYGHIASVTTSLSATSVIRLVSVPSNCNVTSVRIWSGAQTAGKFNIGVYRTNKDGALIAFTSSDSFFTTDLDCASAVAGTEVVFGTGTSGNSLVKISQPLWQAVGMAADPGGMLDICATSHTTDVSTGAGALAAMVRYVS